MCRDCFVCVCVCHANRAFYIGFCYRFLPIFPFPRLARRSDCVFANIRWDHLIDTVSQLCTSPNARVLLAYEHRCEKTRVGFFGGMEQAGFVCERVADEKLHPQVCGFVVVWFVLFLSCAMSLRWFLSINSSRQQYVCDDVQLFVFSRPTTTR